MNKKIKKLHFFNSYEILQTQTGHCVLYRCVVCNTLITLNILFSWKIVLESLFSLTARTAKHLANNKVNDNIANQLSKLV